MEWQRTVMSVLTVCLSRGDNRSHLPSDETVRLSLYWRLERSCSNRVTPRHQRCPSGYAFGVDIVVEQAKSLASKFVDSRSRRTSENPTSVDTEFTPTEVVHQDENNIRLDALAIEIRVQFENDSQG